MPGLTTCQILCAHKQCFLMPGRIHNYGGRYKLTCSTMLKNLEILYYYEAKMLKSMDN